MLGRACCLIAAAARHCDSVLSQSLAARHALRLSPLASPAPALALARPLRLLALRLSSRPFPAALAAPDQHPVCEDAIEHEEDDRQQPGESDLVRLDSERS